MSTPNAARENPADALPELRLKPREERRISAGHLWIFSNEVDTARTPLTAFEPGAACRVVTSSDRFLGYAYVNPHALICARIVGRNPDYPPGKSLIVHRLQVALALRERLFDRPYYRLAFGESDGLPGLVLDRFGDVVVGQTGTAGMEALKHEVVAAVQKVVAPRTFVWKNDSGARELEGLPGYVETAFGPEVDEGIVEENDVRFVVPIGQGQKTGWFYDQAANRGALLKYVPGRRVLDVFCYLGGWGLAAARAGASEVLCVDSSASALELLRRSVETNALDNVRAERGDAFDVLAALRAAGEKFDVVVIDPPAFIKRRKDIPKGQAAYRKLNQLAMQVLARDGILVSCSCSHHLAQDDLMLAIQQSARHLDRFAQVVEVGGHAPDHPIHPAIPETRYLKSLFCRVVHD
ncbi:MAG TPA: class I SAM-dependent rRNA methyltransferase [Steroidobacteraceae bacterium]|nr:class I SAM-dependent rRNA methyltransferase [Steroidobacteraceae bacterium]